MNENSFQEMAKKLRAKQKVQDKCNHKIEEKSSSFTCDGRFGGKAIPLYRCEICGMVTTKN